MGNINISGSSEQVGPIQGELIQQAKNIDIESKKLLGENRHVDNTEKKIKLAGSCSLTSQDPFRNFTTSPPTRQTNVNVVPWCRYIIDFCPNINSRTVEMAGFVESEFTWKNQDKWPEVILALNGIMEEYIKGPKCYKCRWIAHTQEVEDWNLDSCCVLFFGGGQRTIEFRMEKNFNVNIMDLDGTPSLLLLNPNNIGLYYMATVPTNTCNPLLTLWLYTAK